MQSGPSLHIRLCSAQAVFFAVVRTLLPVRIAELLFCVHKCAHIATQMARFAFLSARGRRFGAHLGTQ